VPWHAQTLPAAQSVSVWQVSYVQKHPAGPPPLARQRPSAPPSVHWLSEEHPKPVPEKEQVPAGRAVAHWASSGR
jgi:hypothetical protein